MWGFAQQIYRSERRASCAMEPVRTGPAAEVEVAGDAPPSAAISARIARCEKLRPKDDTLESFIEWMAEHGGRIDDPDELLAQYFWMCAAREQAANAEPRPLAPAEVAPITEPAPVAETPPPPAKRTKKQKAPPADKAPVAREITPAPAKVTLRAELAAERFVEWIRLARRDGTYSSNELSTLYQDHCRAEDLVVLHDNVLRPAMLKLPGVTKRQLDNGGKRGKQRHRPFRWTIAKAATVVDDIPWADLPRRKAA